MADYIGITEAQSNPFAPLTSELVKQLRDNPIAIAEGAAGAPRIRTLAMQSPSVGDDHIIMRLQEGDQIRTDTSYPDTGLHNRANAGGHLGFTTLVSGVVRCYVEHRRGSGPSGSVDVRVLKNGSQIQAWTTSSTSYQTRIVDVSVEVGDVVIFQQRSGLDGSLNVNNAEWRRLRVYSATPDMAVA